MKMRKRKRALEETVPADVAGGEGWSYDLDAAPRNVVLDVAQRTSRGGRTETRVVRGFRAPTKLAPWRQLFESGVQRTPVGAFYAWRSCAPPTHPTDELARAIEL